MTPARDQTALPLLLSMGCPVSIGPEIILRCWQQGLFARHCLVVAGDPGVLARCAGELGIPVRLRTWYPGAPVGGDTLCVYPLSELASQDLAWGQPTLDTARAMIRYIEASVRLILAGQAAALVTCPISKAALQQAGSPFPGHTEMLAHLTGSHRYRMMMAGSRLKVVLVTIHEPLARVSSLLTRENIGDCLALTAEALERDFGFVRPRIAVAALNPHAGERGMFGSEEKECIIPAIDALQVRAEISGPWPADSLFHRAASGEFDVVVAMYHDQGLIPFKLLHFEDGVNVTLGLPIIRTSVDHGTGYDIAGQGTASPASLRAAVELAAAMVVNRARGK